MSIRRFTIIALWLLSTALATAATDDHVQLVKHPLYPDLLFPQVRLETSAGIITVELDRRRAPLTVNNFLRYVTSGRYDGTIFHRVVDGFVVQGGGYKPDFQEIKNFPPIINESGNGLKNRARSIAMARFDHPHSATSQFYFNLDDNTSLDPARRHWGYTVFGRVTTGWKVVQTIAAVKTDYNETLDAEDVPVQAVVLKKASLVSDQAQ